MLARSLSARLKKMEMENLTGPVVEFPEWGLEEILHCSLFATYALLVLQRVREGDIAV